MVRDSDVWNIVRDTVVKRNQTPIDDEGIVYRVVKIRWENLITSTDNNTNTARATGSNVSNYISLILNKFLS